MFKPNEERIRKWVEALRSGEFSQITCTLTDGEGRCCLGVACDVFQRETGEGEWKVSTDGAYAYDHVFFVQGEGSDSIMPDPVAQWFGVLPNPWLEWENCSHAAAELNDNEGLSFEQIADLIEETFLK